MAYSICLAGGAILISGACLYLWTYGDYHRQMGFGIVWVFSLPFITIAGLLGIFTHSTYLALRGSWKAWVLCVAHMLLAVIVGVMAAYALAWVMK